MSCAVQHCKNSARYNPEGVSFHGFPIDDELVLHVWLAATGKPNFIPNNNSKICSAHFADDAYVTRSSKPKLKPKAIPTLFPINVEEDPCNMMETENNEQSVTNDPVDQKTVITENESVHSNSHHSHSSVPSSSIASNLISTSAKASIQFIKMQGTQTLPATHASLSNSCYKPVVIQDSAQSPLCPIKIVDVKKLLQKPPKESISVLTQHSENNYPNDEVKESREGKRKHFTRSSHDKGTRVKHIKNKDSHIDKNETKINTVEQRSNITVFDVFQCLRVILPANFDLSRLIPNEKVAAIVIRYLKVDDSDVSRDVIQSCLKIIVDATSENDEEVTSTKHDYLNITDIEFKKALSKVFPVTFSMKDVCDTMLKCLCIALKKGYFPSGCYILRKKISQIILERKYTKEVCNEQLNSNSPIIGAKENLIKNQVQTSNNKLTCYEDNDSKFKICKTEAVLKSNDKCTENKKIISSHCSENSSTNVVQQIEDNDIKPSKRTRNNISFSKFLHFVEDDVDDPDYVPSPHYINDEKHKVHEENESPAKSQFKSKEDKYDFKNIVPIVQYLDEKECSVKDVLTNFRLMFYLCKYLHIKSKQSNLQKLKRALNFIMERHVDKNNVKQLENEFVKQFENEFYDKRRVCSLVPSTKKILKKHSLDKLKLKPVVMVRKLEDYRTENMLFMGEDRKLYKSNGYYKHCAQFCSQQNLSLQTYSSDYVRKVTSDSYKIFRKIIMRKNKGEIVFRLKYARLNSNSVVFAKDFRNPTLGWVKGTVIKVQGSLKYRVQLDNGGIWCCVPDQLRPLPDSELSKFKFNANTRGQRVVKPKALFDL